MNTDARQRCPLVFYGRVDVAVRKFEESSSGDVGMVGRVGLVCGMKGAAEGLLLT